MILIASLTAAAFSAPSEQSEVDLSSDDSQTQIEDSQVTALSAHEILTESIRLRSELGLDPSPDTVRTIITSRGGDPYSAASMETLVSDFGFIGTAEEVRRIERRQDNAQMVMQALEADSSFQDHGFAGVYIDIHTDQTVLQFTEVPPIHLNAALTREGLRKNDVRIDLVRHSSEYLTELKDELWRLNALSESGEITSISEDVLRNGLDITLSESRSSKVIEEAVTLHMEKTTVPFELSYADVGGDVCTSKDNCNSPQRAGVHIHLANQGGCTSGFTVIRNGLRYALTAGHCWYGRTSGTLYSGSGNVFGTLTSITAYAHNVNGDFRLIRTTNSRPWVYGSNSRKAEPVTLLSYPVINGVACLFGRNITTPRCGTIDRVSVDSTRSDCDCGIRNLVRATYSRSGGDSGGAISTSAVGNVAQGIHSGYVGNYPVFSNLRYMQQYNLGVIVLQ